MNKRQNYSLSTIFPSTSNPSNIKNTVFKDYSGDLIKGENDINTNDLIEFEYGYSFVRIFKDIFLAFDKNKESWYLIRIFVP